MNECRKVFHNKHHNVPAPYVFNPVQPIRLGCTAYTTTMLTSSSASVGYCFIGISNILVPKRKEVLVWRDVHICTDNHFSFRNGGKVYNVTVSTAVDVGLIVLVGFSLSNSMYLSTYWIMPWQECMLAYSQQRSLLRLVHKFAVIYLRVFEIYVALHVAGMWQVDRNISSTTKTDCVEGSVRPFVSWRHCKKNTLFEILTCEIATCRSRSSLTRWWMRLAAAAAAPRPYHKQNVSNPISYSF
jgi:hypothetical protein